MCGRYTLYHQQWVDSLFGGALNRLPAALLRPRYNVAPGQMVLTLRRPGAPPVAEAMHWGIEATWPGGPSQLINARAEKLAESRFWRSAIEHGRCAIPADGFYEWRAVSGTGKQPYWFGRTDGEGFAFAGLCRENAEHGDACVIVTVEANELVAGVHDRMPAMLDADGVAAWLGDDTGAALAALAPFPSAEMTARTVSRSVNDAGREGPELIDEAEPPQAGKRLF